MYIARQNTQTNSYYARKPTAITSSTEPTTAETATTTSEAAPAAPGETHGVGTTDPAMIVALAAVEGLKQHSTAIVGTFGNQNKATICKVYPYQNFSDYEQEPRKNDFDVFAFSFILWIGPCKICL